MANSFGLPRNSLYTKALERARVGGGGFEGESQAHGMKIGIIMSR